MVKNKVEYYLGLDMGTSSVGWAITDQNYHILRKKGKDLWGVREFDEAKTSVDYRTQRNARRRRQRETVRIGILNDYFHDEIVKNDPYFFIRLENSKYYLEDKDKNLNSKYSLFNDSDYTDKEYYKKYPTIFHLRKELIENSNPHDVRLVYLALLNMFKHRGHFYNANLTTQEIGCFQEVYDHFSQITQNIISLPKNIKYDKLEKTLCNTSISKSKKYEETIEILGIKKEKRVNAFIKCLCGIKVKINDMFNDVYVDEDIQTICFSDNDYLEYSEKLSEILGEDNYYIIDTMKQLYDICALAQIRKGKQFICEARVEDYEKHKEDLKKLKYIYKKYLSKDDYIRMFKSGEKGTYSAYVNSFNSNLKQNNNISVHRRNMNERKAEHLYTTIKKDLKKIEIKDDLIDTILNDIENGMFLPKQLKSENGIIPNQIYVIEMKKILNNAEQYLPFLKERDTYGLSVSERIIKIFQFQIPYYIGPLSENSQKNRGNGWVIRKESGPVLPWNIEEKVDIKKTSQVFIERLIRKCTYISGEKVLPKESLEYQSYEVLNEINCIKVNGINISVELKQEIYNELMKKGKKITKKQIFNYLYLKGLVKEESEISGIDNQLNSSLSTYKKFKEIFKENIQLEEYQKIIEKIVAWCTIYGNDKKYLKEQLEENFKKYLDEKSIKRILGLKFKDWGKLSKEFIELSGYNYLTGEQTSLIRAMWDTNLTMMELINSDEYSFKEKLEKKQNNQLKTLTEIQMEDLDDMYFSAPVKRMIWQTLKIIKEIVDLMGCEPKRIFIEMTRTDEDKVRTESRKKQLLKLYKNIKDEETDWNELINKTNDNDTLKSKKMYLYILQQGRCMYTGEHINLDDLFNQNLYDIDHIYPRSITKDDNLADNLVLVKKQVNARKSDTYPIDSKIRNNSKVKELWSYLREKELISEEKHYRLTRNIELTPEEKASFIARQLVETSQSTKGIADILKQVLPNTTIVYSKAKNVSEFRKENQLSKSRIINEFHHAHDAYLNIVVGNVYYVKFTNNPKKFINQEYMKDIRKNHYNLAKMFDFDVVRNNEIAWIARDKKNSTIKTIKETLSRNTPIMSRMNFEFHGAISDDNPISKNKAKKDVYIPLKRNLKMQDVTKYGGFNKTAVSYFFVVEHETRNKKIRTIECVPVYLKDIIESDSKNLLKYCKQGITKYDNKGNVKYHINGLELKNPAIIVKKLKIQSLLKINGYYYYLSGKSDKQLGLRNAVNLCLSREWVQYVKYIENYINYNKTNEKITEEKNIELYNVLMEKHLYTIYKLRQNPVGDKLYNKIELFKKLKKEDQLTVLYQILQLSIIGLTSADLTLIGESKKSGTMKISNNITNYHEFKLINQSVTGIYENEVSLLEK